jgi:hypothetical protein
VHIYLYANNAQSLGCKMPNPQLHSPDPCSHCKHLTALSSLSQPSRSMDGGVETACCHWCGAPIDSFTRVFRGALDFSLQERSSTNTCLPVECLCKVQRVLHFGDQVDGVIWVACTFPQDPRLPHRAGRLQYTRDPLLKLMPC